jgi:hypothetical protein
MIRRDPAAFAATARREIQKAFEQLAIFKRPRSVAVVHFVAALDVEAIKALFSGFEDGPASNMAHRRVVEASSFAIPGIYQLCDSRDCAVRTMNREVYAEARELFEFCYAYEQVDFSFRLADKGQLQIFGSRLTFAYTDKSADTRETALRGRELEIVFTGERLNVDIEAQHRIFRTLTDAMRSRVTCQNDRCEYTCGSDEIGLLRKLGTEMVKSVPAEMDGEASVGGVSFGQLRRYWGALFAISNMHFMAHHLASRGDLLKWPFETVVLRRSRRNFVQLITRVTEMPEEVVDLITGWYVYDSRISNKVPILQPFLSLDSDELCLPMLFVNGNNLERNFFKLMHRHPVLRRFAPTVEERKEPVALGEISSLFPYPLFRTCQCVEIVGLTDADLLVYEIESGFLLVIQHKWLAAPETVEESWGNDEKLADGVRQAVESRDAFRARPELARRALSLTYDSPINTVEAVVVCRGFEHTGFAGTPAVPVITEVSLRALHDKESKLRSLWTVLNSRPDLQRARQQVTEFKWRLKLAGFEFVMPGLMYGGRA